MSRYDPPTTSRFRRRFRHVMSHRSYDSWCKKSVSINSFVKYANFDTAEKPHPSFLIGKHVFFLFI